MGYEKEVILSPEQAGQMANWLLLPSSKALNEFIRRYPDPHLDQLVAFWGRFGYGQIRRSLTGEMATTLSNFLMSPNQVLNARTPVGAMGQVLPFFMWEEDQYLGIRHSGERSGAICFVDEVMTDVAGDFDEFMDRLSRNPRFYLDYAIELERK